MKEKANFYYKWGLQTLACEYMKKFIASSYDIRLLCSNMRIETHGAIYDIKSENMILKLKEANLYVK